MSVAGNWNAKGTILIPAHNEAAVIGRTLRQLCADMAPGEFDVIVVANGCSDETAAEARRALPAARVIDTPQPGKANALRLGLSQISGGHVVFLDADLDVTAADIRRLIAPLDTGLALASHGAMHVDLTGCSLPVRGFYTIWGRSAYLKDGKFGGLFAVSGLAVDRIRLFPNVTADDEYVARSFETAEKIFVREVVFTAHPPRTLASLFKVRKRSLRGTRQLNAHGWVPEDQSGKHGRAALVMDAALRPWLWPALIIFLGLMVFVRIALAVEGSKHSQTWERDDSSRVAATR